MTREEIQNAIQRENEIILDREAKLASEDYKVTKCAEAKIAAKTMPYDTKTLFERRNGYRAEINAAQTEIARLEALEPEDEPTEREDE